MEKKKFLFASLTALISNIAWQVSKEGHEVRYYIKDQKESDNRRWFRCEVGRPGKRRGLGRHHHF